MRMGQPSQAEWPSTGATRFEGAVTVAMYMAGCSVSDPCAHGQYINRLYQKSHFEAKGWI